MDKMKAQTKEQRLAAAEAAQELLNNPAFVETLSKLGGEYHEELMVSHAPDDVMVALAKVKAVKAIRDAIQSAADDLKMLRAHGNT